MDFSGVTILAVGDVMLDRFIEGEIERISPEAPVPILRLGRTREMAGGAGNVANNVASLGGRAILIGLCGTDAAAGALARIFAASRRIEPMLIASSSRPTICKTRFIAARQQVVRTDEESLAPLTQVEEAGLVQAITARIGEARAVILSDYGKCALGPRVIAHAMALARARGLPVFVDPKLDDFSAYRGATCITPNLKELGRAVGRMLSSSASVIEACHAVMERAEAGAILATRSEKGMILVERGAEAVSVRARAREVFDVSGAGDTVIAALALAHASGRSLASSMRVANAAAGIVVSKLGTATANIAEVMHELDAQDLVSDHLSGHASDHGGVAAPSKLQSLARTIDLVAHWKEQGLAVGFTNGCFDILHAGHVALLAEARSHCDRLVVGVNGDASVARLKGPSRPVNALEGRAAVLAAIRHVDCVVGFDDDTPRNLIEAIMPDVLVKGSDYDIANVVGADFVIRAGGKVVLAELVAGLSTTNTIRSLAQDA